MNVQFSKMVMKRKSEFELRIKVERYVEAEAQEAYCKVYLCFIDCQQLRTFEFFRFLMYLNLSFATLPFVLSISFVRFPRPLEIDFIIPF